MVRLCRDLLSLFEDYLLSSSYELSVMRTKLKMVVQLLLS